MSTVPNIFANQTGPIPLSELDANFAAFQASSGSSLIGYNQGGTGAANITQQAKNQEQVCVNDFYANGVSGVPCDPTNTTDSTLGIQAAINALMVTGGIVNVPGNYKISNTLTLYPNVILNMYGGSLNWFGGAAPMISTPTTGSCRGAGVQGGTLNGGSTATVGLNLLSSYQGNFRDINFQSTNTTWTVLYLGCNTTGTTDYAGTRNCVFNAFSNIVLSGSCGRFIQFRGYAYGAITSLASLTGGTLYTTGTYNGVALTGGSGSGATANITVSGGAVTNVVLVSGGTGYQVADLLSATAASIGGTGSGFSIGAWTINPTLQAISTVNSFFNVMTGGNGEVYIIGIDFNQWCDSNVFTGMTRIALSSSVAAVNAVGMQVNSYAAYYNVGAYSECFQTLAIDTFGTPTGDNRIAVYLGFSYLTKIDILENGPRAAGGNVVANTACVSYDINEAPYNSAAYGANDAYFYRNMYGTNISMGQNQNAGYTLYLNSTTNSGATQCSVYAGDTFTGITGTQNVFRSAPVLYNSPGMGQFNHYTITNASLTGTTTLTYQVGLYLPALSGATNNWGIYSTMGAGSYFINHTGAAPSNFGGSIGINGAGAPTQPTGFGTPTGLARLANFPGASATLAQTSGALADLIAQLKLYGFLGA